MSKNNQRARKNRTETENYYISQEVNVQLQAGYSIDQARAIAFRKFREGELYIPNPNQPDTPKELKKERQKQQENALQGIFLLFRLGSIAYAKITEEKKND